MLLGKSFCKGLEAGPPAAIREEQGGEGGGSGVSNGECGVRGVGGKML